MKVRIDKEKCAACGTCFSISPEIFEMDPADGKAKIKAEFDGIDVTDPAMIEKIMTAKDMCPNEAIITE